MSRIVGGEHRLGEREKEVFRRMLRRVAEFSGVEVVTYVVMSNHFHVLVRVPRKGEGPLEDAELVRRYGVLYEGSRSPSHPKPEVLADWLRENGPAGQRWRERLVARMEDVSAFMKTLKQRFSVWYNRQHGRIGTLWADRYKCVVVEGSPQAMLTVAAYIDLNPVRAGLVEDPAAYRWCGYADAMGGDREARKGLASIPGGTGSDWRRAGARYRLFLFGKGVGGAVTIPKIPRERVLEVLREGGEVSRAEALRCRVRYFTDGVVLGSERFVREWWEARGADEAAPKAPEPQAVSGADWQGLVIGRRLRRAVFA
jgi:putative transposase